MITDNNFYHGSDVILGDFHRFPSVLLQSDRYSILNSDAIVLYSILSRRLQLSLRNGWADENNRIYMYYSREEMASDLRVSLSTIHRTVKKLIEADLMSETRQGLGKPNRLYLLKPVVDMIEEAFSEDAEDPFQQSAQSSQSEMSRPVNLTCQDVSDWHSKEIDKNKQYIVKSSSEDDGDMLQWIKTQIGYSDLENSQDVKLVAFIMDVIVNVQKCQNDRFRIGRVYRDTADVKQIFGQINQDAVIHAVEAVKEAGKISNHRNYIVSVLYNYMTCPKEMSRQQEKPKNSFHDFEQRTYDDDLMKQIMEAQGQ